MTKARKSFAQSIKSLPDKVRGKRHASTGAAAKLKQVVDHAVAQATTQAVAGATRKKSNLHQMFNKSTITSVDDVSVSVDYKVDKEGPVDLQNNEIFEDDEPFAPSLDATKMYLREIGANALLTSEEEYKVAKQAARGSRQAKERMIVCNLRLVVKISKHYINRGVSFSDLVAEGNLGLIRAVDLFDTEKGFRFSTYATWWIRQSVELAIMNQGRSVRLPVHAAKEVNLYLRAIAKLRQTLDHEPTCAELAQLVDKPVEEVSYLLNAAINATSLSAPVKDAPEMTLQSNIADEKCIDPFDLAAEADLTAHLPEWLATLSEIEQDVINYRYGMNGFEELTLDETGKKVGVTRERVRQIQLKAVEKLHQILIEDGAIIDRHEDSGNHTPRP